KHVTTPKTFARPQVTREGLKNPRRKGKLPGSALPDPHPSWAPPRPEDPAGPGFRAAPAPLSPLRVAVRPRRPIPGDHAPACKYARMQRYESAPFTRGHGSRERRHPLFAASRGCLATAPPASPRSLVQKTHRSVIDWCGPRTRASDVKDVEDVSGVDTMPSN